MKRLPIGPAAVAAVFFLCAPPPAGASGSRPAGPPGPLDAVATVRYALAHAPAMLSKQASEASLTATYDHKRAAEYPSVDGQVQNQIQKSSHEGGSFAAFGIVPVSNFSQNTAQVTSAYNVYNGTAQVAAQQARRNAESAGDDVRRQAEQTALAASNAFYDLAARREAIVVGENDLAYQQQLLDTAKASEKVGRVAGVDVLRAEVAVARSRATLVQARADEADAREALAVQIGATPETEFAVPERLPEPTAPDATALERIAAEAAAARPDVASAKAALEAAKLGDAGVDADLRPTFQVTGAFGSQISPTSYVLEQQEIDAQNAAEIAQYNLDKQLFPGVNFPPPVLLPPVTRGTPGFWSLGVVSTFTLPFIDYGARAADHRAARAQIAAADSAYQNAVASVEADVRAAARDARAARDKLDLAEQSVTLAHESARIAQLQYKNGLISFNDVSQTEQTAISADNDLIAARVTYVESIVRFRLSLGPSDPALAADVEHS